MENLNITTPSSAEWPGTERRLSHERREFSLQSICHCLVSPRRAQGRRAADRRYPMLDIFDGSAMMCVVLLTLFSILDAAFTLTLLSRGGTELNPVMNFFLGLGTAQFMVAKMLLTTVPAIVLIASSNLLLFKVIRARSVLGALIGMYAGLLVYEMGLLWISS